MSNHHEYHLAERIDNAKETSAISPAIIVVDGNHGIVIRRVAFGFFALLVVVIVVSVFCVHPENSSSPAKHMSSSALLSANTLINNESVTFEMSEAIRGELLKAVSSTNIHEHRYLRSLSHEKLESILQLRLEVEDKLTKDYMRRATYLSSWLRAKDWIVEDAKDLLLDHLDWRVEYEIDSVFETDFSYFETQLPIYSDAVDKKGGPVFSLNLEDWDLRKVAIGGHRREFVRYISRLFENTLQVGAIDQDNGETYTQAILIININKYSLTKHGCFQCIPLLAHLFVFGFDQYPGWFSHIIVINSSDLSDALIDLVLPYLSGEHRAAVEVYGFQEEEWQKKILGLVNADQLRPEFGGTKIDTQ